MCLAEAGINIDRYCGKQDVVISTLDSVQKHRSPFRVSIIVAAGFNIIDPDSIDEDVLEHLLIEY